MDREYFGFDIDVSSLELSMAMARAVGSEMRKTKASTLARDMANDADYLFMGQLLSEARSKPKLFWHLFKANRVGIESALLVQGKVTLNKSGEKGNRGGYAELEYVLLPNQESLSNPGTGTYSSYARQGVVLPAGNARLGFRTSLKFAKRGKAGRHKDYRSKAKEFKWLSQAPDVEFGRKKTITPKKEGGWLAVAVQRHGVVFTRKRVVDYSKWTDNGFLALHTLMELVFPKLEADFAEDYEDQVHRLTMNAYKEIRSRDKAAAAKFTAQSGRLAKSKRPVSTAGLRVKRPNALQRAQVERTVRRHFK